MHVDAQFYARRASPEPGFITGSGLSPFRAMGIDCHKNRCICSLPAKRSSRAIRAQQPRASLSTNDDSWDLSLGSPSKINLFLRVMGKRTDGYHELASLFQSISLRDTIKFSLKQNAGGENAKDTLSCDRPGIPVDESNLIIKALNKFRQMTGVRNYFDVMLLKTIPHAAGLGGGSSNAATTLWAANELSGRPCTNEQLADCGASFGSDISFFLSQGTSYCTGRGEILEDVPQLPSRSLYIVKPLEGLSTPLVFKHLQLGLCSKADPRTLLSQMIDDLDSAEFVNDLEDSSFKVLPCLRALKEKLYAQGFSIVLMSGSGTSFFCFGEPDDPEYLTNTFPKAEDVKVFRAEFVNRKSPDLWYFEKPLVVAHGSKEV